MKAKRFRRWTAAHDAKLARLRASDAPPHAMARAMRRTVCAVKARLVKLRLVSRPKPAPWRARDESRLVTLRLAGTLTTAQIAEQLGRTTSAVANRVRVLTLAKVESRRGQLPALVAAWHAKGLCDADIGRKINAATRVVHRVRKRLGLACNRISHSERSRRSRAARRANATKAAAPPVAVGFPVAPSLSGCWGQPGPRRSGV